jgi:hypothetical protein
MSGKPNTHGEFIILLGGGTAFVDGVPNDHVCDAKGEPAYWTKSGKKLYWHTVREWAHLTWEARLPLLERRFEKLEDPITSGSVTCSICGEAAINQWRDMDFEFDTNNKEIKDAGTDTSPQREAEQAQ